MILVLFMGEGGWAVQQEQGSLHQDIPTSSHSNTTGHSKPLSASIIASGLIFACQGRSTNAPPRRRPSGHKEGSTCAAKSGKDCQARSPSECWTATICNDVSAWAAGAGRKIKILKRCWLPQNMTKSMCAIHVRVTKQQRMGSSSREPESQCRQRRGVHRGQRMVLPIPMAEKSATILCAHLPPTYIASSLVWPVKKRNLDVWRAAWRQAFNEWRESI